MEYANKGELFKFILANKRYKFYRYFILIQDCKNIRLADISNKLLMELITCIHLI